MRFGIGKDLGLVLARGVIVSLITVFLLLPSLALLSYKLIDKTTHRSLIPSFKGFSRVVTRIAIPIVILALWLPFLRTSDRDRMTSFMEDVRILRIRVPGTTPLS